MGKFLASHPQLPRGLGRDRTAENIALPDRRSPKILNAAWLTLGIASVALALIAALVLRSERESTAVLHRLNLIALNLQEAVLQGSERNKSFAEKKSFSGNSSGYFEEFVDEPILTPDVIPAQPTHLALPNYVHRLIALNRSSRSL